MLAFEESGFRGRKTGNEGKTVKNALAAVLVVLALTLSLSAQSSQCLIVRSAEGHRFRNAMIAGVLTGGIGLAAGAAFSGAKYEYADSYNLTGTKPKYSGKELEKLQSEGVHVIVVNKKTAGAEMESARNSCKSSAAPTPQAVSTAAPQAPPAPATPVSAPTQTAPAPAVTPVSTATTQTTQQAPTVIPVPVPVKASAPLCIASMIDANGKETCTQYARQ
jgi:hypothetical protein